MRFNKSKTYFKALADAEKARKKSMAGILFGVAGMTAALLFTLNRAEEYGHSTMFSVCTKTMGDIKVDDDIDT